MKVIFITGASSGIGESLAKVYASPSTAITICARRTDRLEALKKELEKGGSQVLVVSCDVTEPDSIKRAVDQTIARFGHLDVVIANAGFGVDGMFEDTSVDDFRRQFETNIFGVISTIKYTLPHVRVAKGNIAILGSVLSYVPFAGLGAYNMSKAAVKALAESLYLELKEDGVSVTLVCPGFVKTEIRSVDSKGQFHSNFKDPIPDFINMPPMTAAKQIVRAIEKGKREIVITFHAKILIFIQRFAPSFLMWILELIHPKIKAEYARLKKSR